MSSVPPPPPQQPFGPGANPWSSSGGPTPPTYGQPPAPPPPPGFGGPGWSGGPQYGATNPFDGRGTTILVLGILSIVLCQLLGPVGWAMGSSLRKEALAAGWPEPGNAKAGRICSIVGTCFLILVALFVVLAMIGAAASNSGR